MTSNSVIWWIRRDLRLFDNPALVQAVEAGGGVLPLFILDDALLTKYAAAEARIAFLFDGLRSLDADLKRLGSYLIVRRGIPENVLPALVAEVGATQIFAQADSSPYAIKRDEALLARVPLQLTGGTFIRPLDVVTKKDGNPYTVFTPYKKMWLSKPLPHRRDLLEVPERINTPADIASDGIPDAPTSKADTLFPASEAEGRTRMQRFGENGLLKYDTERNFPSIKGTSALSPYLRFGLVSPREGAVLALETKATAKNINHRNGADVWLSELIWREFYNMIQFRFPRVQSGNFRSDYDKVEWLDDGEGLRAWKNGETGYPIVDAAMREMNTTGWMHNRARMIVASFLVKDLLINWQAGEAYFMEKLVDGDPAANNGGWQWAAGTGTDAAPYFRIFNPTSQSQKFDGKGEYIRKWVPELAGLDTKHLHAPWEIPPLLQQSAGVVIGRDYPEPIINHKFARERTLAAYKKAKG